jgi:hypothetical protein
MAKVENFARSIEIKKQQVLALETAVQDATGLYYNPRVGVPIDYLDVLTAQNELFAAIRDLIDAKGQQLSAVVNTYQALGGGWLSKLGPHTAGFPGHDPSSGAAAPGPGDTKPGSAETKPGSAETKPGSAETKPGSGDTLPDPGVPGLDPLPNLGVPGVPGRPNSIR